MQPGEIYLWVSDDGSRRPAIVVSREELNRGDYVVVIPVTTRKLATRAGLPNCVLFEAGEGGLRDRCVAQAEGVQVVAKSELDLEFGCLGQVPPERFRDIVRAVGYVLDANCEPN